MEMNVEINSKFLESQTSFIAGKVKIVVTPPLSKDYWLFRIPLTKNQAVVAFPKFSTYGIGFQVEKEDWNTNLPYTDPAENICNYIKVNKGDDAITEEMILQAIRSLQENIEAFKNCGSLN